ncbi:Barrel-sandwich domain of CusB or HlyD membrane-fusion [Planctomycetales bacterium 10988]|nr:Barrel-sandwich domain of CusB or HlyD membrane-fusion [Planctomycetales bacterium 10988]
MSEPIDLSQLAVNRETPEEKTPAPPKRRWVTRYLLPMLLVIAFGGLFAWAAKDSLLPSQPVTVVPVVLSKVQTQQAGTPLFHAAGWIEPRPSAVVLSSLAPGMVESVLVVEGQLVKEGQPLAQLLDIDAKIMLREAEAEKLLREAELQAAQSELESAQKNYDKPIASQAELAEAESSLAQLEAELNAIPAKLNNARKKQEVAQENLERKQQAGDAVSGRALREAEAEMVGATAEVEQLSQREPVLKRQQQALQRKVEALREQLELKLEETRRLASAKAEVKAAEARLLQAKLAVETSELQLKRMKVYSPINGRVLSIQATPGMRVVGIDPHSEKGASAIMTLYDPQKLQVRVDVRLEDIPQIRDSQWATIESASIPEDLKGQVIGVTSVADIQKNTLQVKVAIENPPDLIRPEMLAQVTFLAPEQEISEESKERLRMLVPRQLVSQEANSATVWIADRQGNVAQRRSIILGSAGTAELIEVTSGLQPTDKLIFSGRESLTEGDRISIKEDPTLGVEQAGFQRIASSE